MTRPGDTSDARGNSNDARTNSGDARGGSSDVHNTSGDAHGEFDAAARATRSRLRRRDAALAVCIMLGLALSVAASRWLEAHPLPESVRNDAEELYVTPESARRLSLGFNGLVADWYWMRTLQYVGRKLIEHPGQVQLDDLSEVNLKTLAPLMDATTTLDPQFKAAYEYGAVILPAVDIEAAIKLARKGIAANPQEWRLYHHLGYIYWQRGQFKEAAAAYRDGARVEGAPRWLDAMAGRMEAEGGDRAVAREIFRRMYDEAEDEQVKKLALRRLAQLRSFDERELIRRALADYRTRAGRCPETWAALAPLLRRTGQLKLDAAGAPLDPAETPYKLVKDGCDVDLDPLSEVPYN